MNPFSAPGVSGAVAHPCSLPGPVPTSGLFPQLWEESEAQGTEGGKPLELCLREEAGVLVRLGPWSQSCQAGAQDLQSVNTFLPGILCCSKGLRGPWREGQTSNASFPSPPGASPSGTGWGQCLLTQSQRAESVRWGEGNVPSRLLGSRSAGDGMAQSGDRPPQNTLPTL